MVTVDKKLQKTPTKRESISTEAFYAVCTNKISTFDHPLGKYLRMLPFLSKEIAHEIRARHHCTICKSSNNNNNNNNFVAVPEENGKKEKLYSSSDEDIKQQKRHAVRSKSRCTLVIAFDITTGAARAGPKV